ncbi:LPS export ABC transporter periplasmic protein LptC [Congregibacter variabilis]|uniref:LPS export ABC transporter periplasmic protein LptC n=1 Tax=Congregibacter variabilis TaxID=3081200 RepID=A0ABZ0I728_9GAMM|nr:LPS export ABC transporter periplasmic protein LptC [Congregibacter sp. IMCC43200]
MSRTRGLRRVRKRLSIPLLLSATLLIYTMLAPAPRLITEKAAPTTDARIPDSYALNVSVNDFNEEGILLGSTQAQGLRRFPREGIVELDEPTRRNYSDDGEWFASARSGQLREKTEVLILEREVRLQYANDKLQFLTDSMIINIPKQAARSTSSVRIWQADNETVAQQIYINLQKQVASLSGSVRTVYVPDS